MKAMLMMAPRRHIIPASEEDRAKMRAYKPGDVFMVKSMKARNYAHHAKFMALVQFVSEHHPVFSKFNNTQPLLHFLKDETGHYTTYAKPDGEIVKIMGSISFGEMDEAEFIVWSDKARRILLDDLLPGFTERDKRRLEREIDGWYAWV